jgi:hypothetical protein
VLLVGWVHSRVDHLLFVSFWVLLVGRPLASLVVSGWVWFLLCSVLREFVLLRSWKILVDAFGVGLSSVPPIQGPSARMVELFENLIASTSIFSFSKL